MSKFEHGKVVICTKNCLNHLGHHIVKEGSVHIIEDIGLFSPFGPPKDHIALEELDGFYHSKYFEPLEKKTSGEISDTSQESEDSSVQETSVETIYKVTIKGQTFELDYEEIHDLIDKLDGEVSA